ncbi:hypothetical protein [Nocardioides sp. zg-DK7169]|uniref:hypothetical protein n=1 Tax=Nocardioides sp. zg-DK7169 TaxID=2736600 RepID=UPI001554ACE5|nr:hypothetical protein [Nocardioides sp. zg-DK7169]NPC96740.1 hypothetical protein [Nocardioides sp. zg-DK7169]
MGYQTDFIGYLQIEPPLGRREISFINRISGSLFLQESGGPLRVADEDDDVLRELLARAPRGWSNWAVCPQGCCLSYDGGDKANHMVPWLKFLMATFLVPGAAAEGIRGITCDHVVTGMVVGSRRDTRELFSITVRDNAVKIELLWPGNPTWSDYPRLAYQIEIDKVRDWVAEQTARTGRQNRSQPTTNRWPAE